MWDRTTRAANVVAVFDTQWDSDEAVLELRLAGFRDGQINYYSRTPSGWTTDLLDRGYWLAGAAIGGVIGAIAGLWLTRMLDPIEHLDSLGLAITCVSFGVLFLGSIGGLIGLGIHRCAVIEPALAADAGPMVIAVDAGAKREQAVAAIRHHGGHLVPADVNAHELYPAGHTA
jgi:hypothetical protein